MTHTLRTLAFAGLSLSCLESRAQQGTWVTDSVSMGGPTAQGAYPQDVFYSMKNGTQKVDSNRDWHLAFEMTPFPNTGVSILANFAQTGIKVYSLNKQASTSFATITAADTVGKTSEARALYNGPRSWYYGALNRNAGGAGMFDYGWGVYDMSNTHNVIGDSVFLLKLGTSAYKLWVEVYNAGAQSQGGPDSIGYKFRIATLDNSINRTVRILRKPTYIDRNFAYYNVVTNTWRDREPSSTAWDITFTRYGDTAYAGTVAQVYPVMGVLSNKGCEVSRVVTLTPDTGAFLTQTYTPRTDAIGANWKYTVGNPPTGFAVNDSFYYFVKSKSTMEYYMLHFTRFDGSATGKAVFRKKMLGIVTPASSVENAATAAPFFALAPNPASTSAQLMLDASEAANGVITVSDLSGRLLQRYPAQFAKGANAFAISTAELPSGTYVVTAVGGAWKAATKLVVQH